MAAQQQPYVTYQDLKAYLKLTDNTDDAFLQLIITKVMGFIDRYTHRTFGWGNPDDPTDMTAFRSITDFPATANGELYDGYAGKILYLNQTDIVSIDQVQLGISTLNEWTVLNAEEFVWRDDGRLILGGNYFNAYDSQAYMDDSMSENFFGAIAAGYQTIQVQYHYGVYGVPPEISLACLDICMSMYILRKNLGIKMERIGDWEQTFEASIRSQLKNEPDALGLLDIMKKLNVGVSQ